MNKKTFLIFIVAVLLVSTVFALNFPIGVQKEIEHDKQIAASITFLLAFLAGIISLTSPCGFALLPAFFSVVFKDRKKAVLMAGAFSIGLTVAFTIFGLIAGMLGNFFNNYKLTFAVVSGFILIFFGILLFLNTSFTFFNFKTDYTKREGFFSVAALGFFFGVGWTPCVGPILGGVLLLAANTATLLSSTLMLVFYSLGIAVPLIVLAYFSDKKDWANSRLLRGKEISFNLFSKRIITHTYNLIGGALLIIIGIIMVIFKGTFFFQSELPKYIPWSMSLWSYLNEKWLESKILTSVVGNVLGVIIVFLIAIFIVYYIYKNRNIPK